MIVNKFLLQDGIRTSALMYQNKPAGLFDCVRYVFWAKIACSQKNKLFQTTYFFANKRQKQAESSNAPLIDIGVGLVAEPASIPAGIFTW